MHAFQQAFPEPLPPSLPPEGRREPPCKGYYYPQRLLRDHHAMVPTPRGLRAMGVPMTADPTTAPCNPAAPGEGSLGSREGRQSNKAKLCAPIGNFPISELGGLQGLGVRPISSPFPSFSNWIFRIVFLLSFRAFLPQDDVFAERERRVPGFFPPFGELDLDHALQGELLLFNL